MYGLREEAEAEWILHGGKKIYISSTLRLRETAIPNRFPEDGEMQMLAKSAGQSLK